MTTLKKINLLTIRLDGGTQARASIDADVLNEYAAAVTAGEKFPPIITFFDGSDYWLGDGFHRLLAHKQAGKTTIESDVRTGTQRDAIYLSLCANNTHGMRMTALDKRRAVTTMLADPEWAKLSDREIAKHCGCTHPTVAAIRNPPAPAAPKAPKKVGGSTPTGGGTPADTTPVGTPAVEKFTTPAAPAAEKTEAEKQAAQIADDAHGDTNLVEELAAAHKLAEDLQAQIAVASADDAKAEAMKWKRIADIARNRQNELQALVNAREDDIKRLQKTLRRIGAAVGEEDPTKIAATVEAFVKAMKEAA